MLDWRGNRDPSEWPVSPQIRGGMPYFPPTHDWIGYGLKVIDQYDYGNNEWVEMNGLLLIMELLHLLLNQYAKKMENFLIYFFDYFL